MLLFHSQQKWQAEIKGCFVIFLYCWVLNRSYFYFSVRNYINSQPLSSHKTTHTHARTHACTHASTLCLHLQVKLHIQDWHQSFCQSTHTNSFLPLVNIFHFFQFHPALHPSALSLVAHDRGEKKQLRK